MMKLQELYNQIINYFKENNSDAETELDFSSVFQLLVAVVLSAQCTDKRVNMVTPALFAAYPTPKDMANANEAGGVWLCEERVLPQCQGKTSCRVVTDAR